MPPKRKAAHSDDVDAAATPEERRAIQVRLAQRAFRQRREDRIKELEALVDQLRGAQQAQQAQQVQTCANCDRERQLTNEYMAHTRLLEKRVIALQAECDQLRKGSQCPLEKNTNNNNNNNNSASAEVAIPAAPVQIPLQHPAGIPQPTAISFNNFYGPCNTQQQPPAVPFSVYNANVSSGSSSQPQQPTMFLQPAFPSTSSSLLSPSGGHAPILQQQQQQQLIRPIVTDYSSLNADSLNLLGSTAAERFGGPPIVKWAKQALHALSSLTHCQWVDIMFDTFVSQSTCNEKETIRNSSVKILNAKYKLFDSCSIQDKPKAIEIIEMAREQNRVHVDYMYEYARATVTPLGARLRLSSNDVVMAPMAQQLKQALIQNIPCLLNAHELIDEMCATLTVLLQCNDREEKADRLLQLVAIKDKLARQCPDLGERTRLILEMEKVRLQSNENRKLLESIFDGVTTENSCLLHDC